MPNVERMISLKDALDHIEQVVLAKHIAIKHLYEALVDERVVAVSERFVRKVFYKDGTKKVEDPAIVTLWGSNWREIVGDDASMPSTFPIEWFNSRWFYSKILHNSHEGITFIRLEAEEIKVYERQVKTLWPHPATVSGAKNKGGRPLEHDWFGAYVHCCWWVFKNELPDKKERLVELAVEWFDKNDLGGPKDKKEIAANIRKLYDALERCGGGKVGV